MSNNNEKNEFQIIRLDAKNCFVESMNDYFSYGKVHLQFVKYDLSKPAGSRQTEFISIFIDIPEFLVLASASASGRLKSKAIELGGKSVYECFGGTSARRLKVTNQSRSDGKSLSRVFTISNSNAGFFFSAASGPGEENQKGLISPKYGSNPENQVSVAMSERQANKLFLITQMHYQAWLTAEYSGKNPIISEGKSPINPSEQSNVLSNGSEIGKSGADDIKMF